MRGSLGLCDHEDWAADDSYKRALVQGMMMLGSGGAFMHGSHTKLGDIYDADMKALVSYTAYQSFISKLNTNDPILLGMSEEPQLDSREVAERITML